MNPGGSFKDFLSLQKTYNENRDPQSPVSTMAAVSPNPPHPNPHRGYTLLGTPCNCICHTQPGVQHFIACCSPEKPNNPIKSTVEQIASDEDSVPFTTEQKREPGKAKCPKCLKIQVQKWIGGCDGGFFWKCCDEWFTPTEIFLDPSPNPTTEEFTMSTHEQLEQEVKAAMDKDSTYPLGETDATKWAVAWRLTRDKNNIDANASQESGDIDRWMTVWFANCMGAAEVRALSQSEPSVTQEDAVFHVSVLENLLTHIPDYEGDDPRANHYRAQRNAISTAIRLFKSPDGDIVDDKPEADSIGQIISGAIDDIREVVEDIFCNEEPDVVDIWKDYRDAGHDVESMLAKGGSNCSRCNTPMINLSEDLMYGEMRKCVSPNSVEVPVVAQTTEVAPIPEVNILSIVNSRELMAKILTAGGMTGSATRMRINQSQMWEFDMFQALRDGIVEMFRVVPDTEQPDVLCGICGVKGDELAQRYRNLGIGMFYLDNTTPTAVAYEPALANVGSTVIDVRELLGSAYEYMSMKDHAKWVREGGGDAVFVEALRQYLTTLSTTLTVSTTNR